MSVILRGITHVIIETARTKAQAAEKGVYAVAQLCFGPGDENCISQIEYVQSPNKRMVWRMPAVSRVRDGAAVNLLVFNGALAEELCQWASRAMERIKKDLEVPKLNRVYRVSAQGEATDITQESAA